jgi:hypothetical protein
MLLSLSGNGSYGSAITKATAEEHSLERVPSSQYASQDAKTKTW